MTEDGVQQHKAGDSLASPISPLVSSDVPLSLYIHIPWCVRKCPYCDFNSHKAQPELPEHAYIDAMLEDLDQDISYVQERPIQSIFFGGGTPSLFSAEAISRLLKALHTRLPISPDCEITLEANPGTFEQNKFAAYREAGINRLSLGVQSFHDEHLKKLGRIHSGDNALTAIHSAQSVGFTRLNVDLMHGLPGQTSSQAVADIHTALDAGASHLSWYQLTIEPNTHFHKMPPRLPVEDTLADIQERGLAAIATKGLRQYEVSAYAIPGEECRHNLNYWRFGDYLALGAGAHGKITVPQEGEIFRYQKTRLPEHYLERLPSRTTHTQPIAIAERPFEFLMNALRLKAGFDAALFAARTGLDFSIIEERLSELVADGLLEKSGPQICCSATGSRFLDDVVARFLN